MKIKTDDEEYDHRQRTLTYAILRFTKDHLEAAKLSKEQVKSLTTQIAFTVASIVDGSQLLYQRSSGKRLQPVLMFADDADCQQLVAGSGGSSSMHEHAHAIVDTVFEQQPA